MTGALRQLRAETYRLVHARLTVLVAALLVAVPLLRVGAAYAADVASHAARVQRAFARGESLPDAMPVGNAWPVLVDGWLAGLTLVALILLLFASRSLAGDLDAGLLRQARTRSVSRAGLVLGRALLAIPLLLGGVALTGAAAGLGAAALYAFGPIVEDGYELLAAHEIRAEVVRGVLVALPALLGTYGFGLLVSAIARSGLVAVSAALTLYLAFDLFKDVLGTRQYWTFAAFCPSFVDNSYMKEVASMARGFSDAGYTEEVFARNLWLPLPQAALLVALACWATRRRAL